MTAEPDWRMGFLHGLRLHGNILELRKAAMKRHPVFCPKALDDLEVLAESSDSAFGCKAISRILSTACTQPHPDNQSAV